MDLWCDLNGCESEEIILETLKDTDSFDYKYNDISIIDLAIKHMMRLGDKVLYIILSHGMYRFVDMECFDSKPLFILLASKMYPEHLSDIIDINNVLDPRIEKKIKEIEDDQIRRNPDNIAVALDYKSSEDVMHILLNKSMPSNYNILYYIANYDMPDSIALRLIDRLKEPYNCNCSIYRANGERYVVGILFCLVYQGKKYTDSIIYLIESRCNVNEINNGRSVLWYALHHKMDKRIIEALYINKADIKFKPDDDISCIDMMKEQGYISYKKKKKKKKKKK